MLRNCEYNMTLLKIDNTIKISLINRGNCNSQEIVIPINAQELKKHIHNSLDLLLDL